MLCEKIIGSLHDKALHERLAGDASLLAVEEVPFTWDEVHKRIQRKRGSNGTEIGIRLDEDARRRGIHDGDVLGIDERARIMLVAHIVPEPAAVVRLEHDDPLTVARVAWEIGNTHTQLFSCGEPGTFAFPVNEPLCAGLSKIAGVSVSVESVALDPDHLLSAGIGGHTHSHVHENGDGHTHPHGHEGHEHPHSVSPCVFVEQ